jgi:LmbE family N-acetylglucosaminyl deacetylase
VRHLGLPDGGIKLDMEIARKLRAMIDEMRPNIVLLPWFLDCQQDHRAVNVLYAWGCHDLRAMVVSFEIWEMLVPNAILDIADVFEEKIELVRCYRTQTATVDYVGLCEGLAKARAFYNPTHPNRGGLVEGYFTLPSADYCERVRELYGAPGQLSAQGEALLS